MICSNLSHFVHATNICCHLSDSTWQCHGPSKLNWHFRHIDDLWRAWEHGHVLPATNSAKIEFSASSPTWREPESVRITKSDWPFTTSFRKETHFERGQISSKLGYITCRTWQEVFDCKYFSISSRGLVGMFCIVLPPDSKDASNVAPAINIATSTKGIPAKRTSPHFTGRGKAAELSSNARQPKKSQAP